MTKSHDYFAKSATLLLEKTVEDMSEEECCAHLYFLSRYIVRLYGPDEKQAFSLCNFGMEILQHWISLASVPTLLHDDISADVLLKFLFVMDLCVLEDERIDLLLACIKVESLSKKVQIGCLGELFSGPYTCWMGKKVLHYRLHMLCAKADRDYAESEFCKNPNLVSKIQAFVFPHALLSYVEQDRNILFRWDVKGNNELIMPLSQLDDFVKRLKFYSIDVFGITWWLQKSGESNISHAVSIANPGLCGLTLPDSEKTIQELPYALLEFGAEWDVCVRAKEWARHSEFDAEKLYVGVWMVNG